MELLKKYMAEQCVVLGTDFIKVDMFLNHQIDIGLMNEIGREFKRLFADAGVTKILTIESSGIAVAAIAAQYFDVPVIFARKYSETNVDSGAYESDVYSYTKKRQFKIRVSKQYIAAGDRVLILDDILANGPACLGLCDVVSKAGAVVSGIGVVIEKSFQNGRRILEEQGYRIESLARIGSLKDGKISFLE